MPTPQPVTSSRVSGLMALILFFLSTFFGANKAFSWTITTGPPKRYFGSFFEHRSTTMDADLMGSTVAAMDPSSTHDEREDDRHETPVNDNRPFAQRAPRPRPARRLNHGFKYLYRHDVPDDLPEDPMQYLMQYGGYSEEQVLAMNATFPPLLSMSVSRQLHPKMRFLKETLGISHPHLEATVPAEYFGARLERTLAPRHAWLVHGNLTHGSALFRTMSSRNTTLWTDFVRAARKPHGMAALCTQWARESSASSSAGTTTTTTTPRQIEAFDTLFGRGLLAMARDELVQPNNTWPLEHFSTDDNRPDSDDNDNKPHLTAADLTRLLIQHGADPAAVDHRGVSLSHWAAGAGNLPVLSVLHEHHDDDSVASLVTTRRDHATLLHWAATGARARAFGCGGHVHVCEYLLSQWDRNSNTANDHSDTPKMKNTRRRDYVNALTLDGNSALHWAAWSGTLDTVKLLVRHRANVHQANRNGCTVAHWAASGGNVEVCRYLHTICRVDFTEPNHGGNTPLTHAVAFGRAQVVEWLRNDVLDANGLQGDEAALGLAQDFVGWLPADERRKQVLQLFQEFLEYDQGNAAVGKPSVDDDEDEDFVY